MCAEDLGAPGFRRSHGVRFDYVVGEMAGGIASVEMVVAAARSGMLAFFGSGGLDLTAIKKAISQLQERLGDTPFVLPRTNPFDRDLEERTVDLLLRKDVRIVSASAFMGVTPAVVRLPRRWHARAAVTSVIARIVSAKLSAPRSPNTSYRRHQSRSCRRWSAGALSAEEASAAALIPVAEAVTGEGDSGGHTDRRPLTVLLPATAGDARGSCRSIRFPRARH